MAIVQGTSGDDTLTVYAGDDVSTGGGNDTITASLLIGTNNLNPTDRTTIDAGTGNDIIIDQSVRENPFPITANGGDGDDTFIVSGVVSSSETTYLTGGSGNDTFEFSTQPFHATSCFGTSAGHHTKWKFRGARSR